MQVIGDRGEVHTGGPALNRFMDTRYFLGTESLAHAFECLLGLLECELKCRAVDCEERPTGLELGEGERGSGTCSECHVHRSRSVIDEVLHRIMALRIRDDVVIVQHQNQSARNIEQAVEHVGDDLVEVGLWLEKEEPGPVGESWYEGSKREEHVSPEERGIVLRLLEGKPPEPPHRICLRPLHEDGRLAVAGRSLEEGDLAVPVIAEASDELVPSNQIRAVHRRADLGHHQGRRGALGRIASSLSISHCFNNTDVIRSEPAGGSCLFWEEMSVAALRFESPG